MQKLGSLFAHRTHKPRHERELSWDVPEERGVSNMGCMQTMAFHFVRRLIFCLAVALTLLVAARKARAQSAQTLAEIKKVYVEKFSEDDASGKLRDRLIEQLRKGAKLEIVPAPNKADAIIKGSGSVWVIGYVSTDPRAPANARQAIYRGYLSVEVLGKNNEPLWSYLATPSKMRSGSITQDLAEQLAAKLAEAMRQHSEKAPVTTVASQTTE